MRLLYTSTLCIWDNSILVMLCFYGDLVRIFYFIKNILRFLPIALPLKLGALHASPRRARNEDDLLSFFTS
jgi:hypothetical protein